MVPLKFRNIVFYRSSQLIDGYCSCQSLKYLESTIINGREYLTKGLAKEQDFASIFMTLHVIQSHPPKLSHPN